VTGADPEVTRLALADVLDQYTALAEVVRAIGRAPLDLEEALRTILDHAVRLCHSERGFIYLLDGDVYRHVVEVGAPPEVVAFNKAHPIRPTRATQTGRTALERRPVHIPDVLADPEYDYPEAQRLGGFRSSLGVPMLREGVAIGVIDIWRDEVRPFAQREIDLVALFADQATIAFETTRLLRTVDRQRTELARFLSPQVAALISSDEGEAMLAGHRREISVVFCDLRGFTAFSESAAPEEVLAVLREYHAAMGGLIAEHGGTLERFAGDGIMVFFNDPIAAADHTERAVRMAVAMRDRGADLAAGWRKLGHELGFGVGIAVGYATLGRIGFEGRFDYGAIGSVVNLAARLCAEAAEGSILLSQRAFAAVEDLVEARPVGPLVLKGFGRPVPAFDVVGLRTGAARGAP
jgi:class 3 adenylate cyclase